MGSLAPRKQRWKKWLTPQRARSAVQTVFAVVMAWSGFEFYRFYLWLQTPVSYATVTRPPSVEAFLPIGGMLGFRHWLHTGDFDPIHPAAIVFFILIVLTALLVGRAFCSWICPIGTLQEWVSNFGRKLLYRIGVKQWVPKGWEAMALGFVKYVLLAFFVYIAWFALRPEQLLDFQKSPYNRIVDFKMLLFFLQPATATLITIVVLVVASLFIANFWCRFLCPYGALLGLLGKVGLTCVWRNKDACDDCGACERVCPNGVRPQTLESVRKDSCTVCLSCVQACPRKCLGAKVPAVKKHVSKWASVGFVGGAVVAIFVVGIVVAKVTGHWESALSADELRSLLPVMGALQHH